MHPLANFNRAFAMSTRLVNTGTPTASNAPPRRPTVAQQHVEVGSSGRTRRRCRGCAPRSCRADGLRRNPACVMSGSAAITAGLNRSLCPTASVAPLPRPPRSSASASSTDEAIGFSTSARCRSAAAAARRRRAPRSARRRPSRRSRLRAAIVRGSSSVERRRDSVRARRIGIHHGGQLDAVEPRENPRVMPAQMTDANHRDAKWILFSTMSYGAAGTRIFTGVVHPTTVNARLVGRLHERVAIEHQRLAGVQRQRRWRPAAFIAAIVGSPTTGTSKRMSCFGFATLTTDRPGARQTPRPRDHFVGAFHRLDRHHRAILHDDRLTDVEPRDRHPPCGSRTRSPPRRLVGRPPRVITPGRASSGRRKARWSPSA